MSVDIDGLRRLLANPCCGACVIKATEGALPALLAEAEAGRKLAEAVRQAPNAGYWRAIPSELAEFDAVVKP